MVLPVCRQNTKQEMLRICTCGVMWEMVGMSYPACTNRIQYSSKWRSLNQTRITSLSCKKQSVSNNVLHHKLDYRKQKRNQTGISKSALVAQINTYRHPCLEEGCYIDGAHLSGLLQTIQTSHTGTGGAVVALPR